METNAEPENEENSNQDLDKMIDGQYTYHYGESIRIPIIEINRARDKGFFDNNGNPKEGKGWDTVEAPRMLQQEDNASAVIIDDDSMPFTKPGWIVFCVPDLPVQNDDLVIIQLKNGRTLFRQVKFHNDIIILHSFNSSYDDIPIRKEEIVFFNKVVEVSIPEWKDL